MFFSFDGIDGVGKSTQIERFGEWLSSQGHEVVYCRDPGTTPLGERVRSILLDSGDDVPIDSTSEMLLYMAARAQLVEEFIRPALAAGQTVVTDRFLLSNVVYQGYARGLDVKKLWQVGEVATGSLEPDLYLVLDMSPEAAVSRIDRPLDRMELQGDEFNQRLRDGFLREAKLHENIAVVDASQTIEEVHIAVRAAAERVLG